VIEIVVVEKEPYSGFMHLDRFGKDQGFSGIARQALA